MMALRILANDAFLATENGIYIDSVSYTASTGKTLVGIRGVTLPATIAAVEHSLSSRAVSQSKEVQAYRDLVERVSANLNESERICTEKAQIAQAAADRLTLSSAVDSTRNDCAATPLAVKTAYDAAKSKLPLAGGVLSGSIQINDPANDIAVAPPANTERGMFLGDKNSVVMGGFDVIQRASDNAKYTQFYSKNSRGDIASLAAVTYEDGTRELVADSPLQINDIQIKQVVDGGRRVIVLSGARGNQGHSFRFSPDTGEAYMDGRVIHAKADTAGYADTAGSAPANGGTAWAANRLRREGGVDTVWNWAGQGGQPGWLWGGNDGVNMYVYNPANFSVNYANSAGGARTVSINYAAYNDFPLNANFTMPFDGLAVIFVTGSGWGHIKLFVNGAEVSRARMYGEDSANPCDSPSAFVRSGIVVQGQVNGSRISGVVRCFPGA